MNVDRLRRQLRDRGYVLMQADRHRMGEHYRRQLSQMWHDRELDLEDIANLRDDLDRVKAERDAWRDKYWLAIAEVVNLQAKP